MSLVKKVNRCKPVSRDEVLKILKKVCTVVPNVSSLTGLLMHAADDKSFMTEYDGSILSNVKSEGVNYSLYFQYDKGFARMGIYNCPIDQIPASGCDIFCDEIAYIFVGPKRTGLWAAGKDDQVNFGIYVQIKNAIMLPTVQGQWFFEMMKWFAVMSGELHSDASEQLKYWGGK
ncbi:hypothetical protein KY319_02775 [Candidatus Woesearchaeota archaeon]|nr:hypothetical protein [Candidatus Woesearchaeota archaeon]